MKKGTKSSENKSQLIRDFATANPSLGAAEIVKALTEQGHKIYPALVSQALRGTAGGKKRKPKRGRKPGAAKATTTKVKATTASFNLENVKAAAQFVKSQGSIEDAISSIRNFEKIAALLK
jgi:hypothetical protein